MKCFTVLPVLLALVAVPAVAAAHSRLMSPTPRSPSDGLKTGPCGNIPPTGTVTELVIGDPITVTWEETIDHPGYYTIGVDTTPASDDQTEFDAGAWTTNATDVQGGQLPHSYSFDYTVPNTPCNPCTLQLRQFMSENSSFYHSCADIAIVTEPSTTPTPSGDDDDAIGASGCSCALGATRPVASGLWWLALGLAVGAWVTRHRRHA